MAKYWTETEKWTIIGFVIGLLFVLGSYFFDIGFQKTFCFEMFEPMICFRHVSFFPLILAIIGSIAGFIMKRIRQRREENKAFYQKEQNINHEVNQNLS